MSLSESPSKNVQLTGPFDNLRDYLTALEARGRLIRIKEMDQDHYETTGFAYRLIEKFGLTEAPAFVAERVKIDGKWIDGPVYSNIYGGWDTEAISFGIEHNTEDQIAAYRATLEKLVSEADGNGELKRIKPVTVDSETAPCKEVVISGEDVDILQYPWLKCNPADGGRYINFGSVIIEDPQLGKNVGTYRCQVKDKKRFCINPEKGQHGWSLLMAAKARGEKSIKVAIVLGSDPITWSTSSSKITQFGEDEYELAGGLKGKPLELVKCETSDILVPANAEMIIEGDVPLDQTDEEGPHAEMYGYLGQWRDAAYFVNVETITHRKDPIFINVHTGVTRGYHRAPMEANTLLTYKRSIHNLVAIHSFDHAPGVTALSINKRFAGDGLAAGQQVAAVNYVTKVVIVVDQDVDVLNEQQVLHAMGTRWQPDPATIIIPHARATFLEPSCRTRCVTSKVIIDATKQLPDEGGPDAWPPVSRELLEEGCADVFKLVDEKWSEYWSKTS